MGSYSLLHRIQTQKEVDYPLKPKKTFIDIFLSYEHRIYLDLCYLYLKVVPYLSRKCYPL